MSRHLPYKAPPLPPMLRRVYHLPTELVEHIQAYGFENGHQSEVSAVRELLVTALNKEIGT